MNDRIFWQQVIRQQEWPIIVIAAKLGWKLTQARWQSGYINWGYDLPLSKAVQNATAKVFEWYLAYAQWRKHIDRPMTGDYVDLKRSKNPAVQVLSAAKEFGWRQSTGETQLARSALRDFLRGCESFIVLREVRLAGTAETATEQITGLVGDAITYWGRGRNVRQNGAIPLLWTVTAGKPLTSC